MDENCEVRGMLEDDLPMVLAWRNHPQVRRFMLTQHEISLAEHCQWFQRAVQDSKRRLLIVQEHGNPIGYVQFSSVEPGGISDWGFYVRPDAEKGMGRKLGDTALHHAFSHLKLHKVCGQTMASNHPSIRFHERLGFKREAEIRDQKRLNDQHHNLICFGLLHADWQAHTKDKSI
jgi:UDP-4-amino-4,6-dideoxy-N-acetyl-beta-L-altrosamine N-acetyltransferase